MITHNICFYEEMKKKKSALLMHTHNICFHGEKKNLINTLKICFCGEIRKISILLDGKKHLIEPCTHSHIQAQQYTIYPKYRTPQLLAIHILTF